MGIDGCRFIVWTRKHVELTFYFDNTVLFILDAFIVTGTFFYTYRILFFTHTEYTCTLAAMVQVPAKIVQVVNSTSTSTVLLPVLPVLVLLRYYCKYYSSTGGQRIDFLSKF
jgi:hypothetical protein